MKQKNLTAFYAVFQIAVWGSFGIIVSYASPYCLHHGLTDAQYGMLFALVAAGSFALQLALAELISRFSRLTLKRTLTALGAVMLLCCVGMFLLPLPQWASVALYALTALLVQCLPSLVNALGMAGMQRGQHINFGLSRGLGSLGYALLAFLTGQLIALTSTAAVPALYTGVCVVLILAAQFFPEAPDTQQAQRESSGGGLLRDGKFLLFLLGATALYVCHNLLCNFLYQIVTERGGAEPEQGIASFIAAVSELPVMFLFCRMLKKGRCDTWLKISGLFVTGKALVCLCVPGIGGVYAAQVMQLLGFSMFAVSSVYYVGSVVPPTEVVRSQTLLAATCALSNVLSSLVGGWLTQLYGVSVLLLSALGAGVFGTILLFLCLRPVEQAVGSVQEE